MGGNRKMGGRERKKASDRVRFNSHEILNTCEHERVAQGFLMEGLKENASNLPVLLAVTSWTNFCLTLVKYYT